MQPLLVGGDGSGRSWAPRAGDGIGVVVMWLDGTSGLFLVNNRPQINSVLAMRVLGSWSTTQGMPMSDDGGLALFAIGQGVDWVVQRVAVGGATALGGPVAGAMAAVIVGSVQTVNDIDELSNLAQRNRRVIWLRSAVALTAAPDGRNTLYVFEGAPGVEDAAGGEAPVAPGEAVEFALEGEITPPAVQEPSPAAQALFDALPAADAPVAASTEGAAMEEMVRDGAGGSIARAGDAAGEDAASGWAGADLEIDGIEDIPAADWPAGLVIGVATMAVVASLGLAWRRRGQRAPAAAGSAAVLTLQPVEPPKTRKKSSAPSRATRPKRSRVASPAAPQAVAADEPLPAPPAPPKRPKTPASAGTAICPRCGKTIRAGARFCGECGAPREPVAEASPPDVNICPACQAPLRPGARFLRRLRPFTQCVIAHAHDLEKTV